MYKSKKIISLLCSVLTFATCFNINIPGNIKTVHAAESTYTYNFTGTVQTFTAPETGKYYFEITGASGGGARVVYGYTESGSGGHSAGYIMMRKNESVYITLGGQGTMSGVKNIGGYNGGGNAIAGNGSGGGATSITKTPTTLPNTAMENIILIAGGGGGAGSTQTGMYSGSGGGLESKEASFNSGGTQTFGISTHIGGDGFTGGAGGGGYMAGYASTISTKGGGGGSGYINTDIVQLGTTSPSFALGNGTCTVKYAGPAESTLTISGGGVGLINGKEYDVQTKKLDEVIKLPTPVKYINQPGIFFTGYTLESGDGILTGNLENGYTFKQGFKNSVVKAQWVSNFTVDEKRNGTKVAVKINVDDYTVNTYFVERSFDKVKWDKLLEDGTVFNGAVTKTYSYTMSKTTYPSVAPGSYHIFLRGGGGGEDGGHWGGSGATIEGIFYVKRGQSIQIEGGQAGQNSWGDDPGERSYGGHLGGGSAWWSGGGGGAYFAYIGGIPVMAAAGGGGATNDGNIGQGGRACNKISTAFNASNIYGHVGGDGSNGDGGDGGGGGGGWIGGYGGINEKYSNQRGGGGGLNGIVLTVNGREVREIKEQSGNAGQGGHHGEAKITPIHLEPFNADLTVNATLEDHAAPDAPSDGQVSATDIEGKIGISWSMPKDNGSDNYFRATRVINLATLASDITSNEIVENYESGLKGYYYVFDNNIATVVTNKNTYISTNKIATSINLDDSTPKYFHVAAVDNSGNVSKTYTITIQPKNIPNYPAPDESNPKDIDKLKTFPIYTDKIAISSSVKNYYLKDAASNTYWVKGSTNKDSKFNLSFNGTAKHPMRFNYQINKLLYDVTLNQPNIQRQNVEEYMFNTSSSTGTYKTGTNNGSYNITGSVLDFDSATLTRYAYNRLNNLTTFTANAAYDNKTVTLIPEARSIYAFNSPFQTSSKDSWTLLNGSRLNGTENDILNKINLIIDSTVPTVTIPDKFKEDDVTHRVPLITEPTTFPVSYVDYVRDVNPSNPEYGSGVTEGIGNVKVIVTQEQTDNGGPSKTKIYNESTVNKPFKVIAVNEKSGRVDIAIDPYVYEEMSGFIKIRVEITDNVGNTVSKEYRFLVMTLNTEIERAKTLPAAEYFKGGEHGSIKTETNGFIDQIKYAFPSALDDLAAVERSNAGDIDNPSWDVGRVLSDTYPRDESGKVTRVTKNMQTQFWGSKGYLRIIKKGGMEWDGNDYVHSYLEHFFYVPLYTGKGTYKIVVTMYKQDPLYTENIYSTSNVLYLGVGMKPEPSDSDIAPDTPEPITDEFRDTIKDN